jgi:hypothetical protein
MGGPGCAHLRLGRHAADDSSAGSVSLTWSCMERVVGSRRERGCNPAWVVEFRRGPAGVHGRRSRAVAGVDSSVGGRRASGRHRSSASSDPRGFRVGRSPFDACAGPACDIGERMAVGRAIRAFICTASRIAVLRLDSKCEELERTSILAGCVCHRTSLVASPIGRSPDVGWVGISSRCTTMAPRHSCSATGSSGSTRHKSRNRIRATGWGDTYSLRPTHSSRHERSVLLR